MAILFIVFLLQAIWLYQTFLLTKENLRKQVTQEFISSIQKEVDFQEKSRQKINIGKDFTFSSSNIDISVYPVNIILLEAQYFYNTPPIISNIDSLLSNALKEKNIADDFVINRRNTIENIVIESTAPETQAQWSKALKTKEIPMRLDQSETLQLLVLNPNWSIFHQMSYIILLSALVVFLVAIGLWWQYKNYLKEKQIRQFQKDHTEATVHNMVTPLQTVSIANNTLRENTITQVEKQQKFLQMQRNQIDNLQNQVEKILTVSRANNSGIVVNKTSVNIEELINMVCESFNKKSKKQVCIQKHFKLSKKIAKIDAQLFSDVLNNLIENSIKYSRDTVNIVITTQLTAQNLKIKIADNGLGIAPKYQNHIFDKFNRGAAPFRDGAKGFGIGLSFVKVVTEAHNGTVNLFSKGENKGTTFTIQIPQEG